MTPTELKARMEELGVSAKRSLGQNFLINPHVIEKIVAETSESNRSGLLIEIGPGLGSLTEPLLQLGRSLTLLELDREFAAYWRSRGLNVIEGDALHVDWENLVGETGATLVSNLPYQISTHLVVDRCFGPSRLTHMILMFQKEVAQRLAARPRTKEYGFLSVMAQTYWDFEKVTDASARDFLPVPNVASRVLSFHRKPGRLAEREYLRLLKAAFRQRRKFLLKNLKELGHNGVGHNPFWEPRLEQLGVSLKARAEELTVAQFQALYDLWKGQ